jgi:DNA-binding SARP family transcriptional activator
VTQRELAAAAGMSLGALRDLEQGRTRFPRWGTVEKLAAVLCLGQAERAELAQAWRASDEAPVTAAPGGAPTGEVSVEVLGPLAAWRNGSAVALGPARQRAVLGALALHAGAGLHRDAIIDLLWGQEPPASAVPKVQAYVSRLRQALGDGPPGAQCAGLVTTLGGCYYRLSAEDRRLRLDLEAFRRMTSQARAARADPADACSRYEQALRLWRGDVLADVSLLREHPAAIEAARQRAEAILAFARAATQCQAHGRVLPHLRWLCAAEPLNEEAHAWLMTTLAATGQQAAALQAFTRVARRLKAELGVIPSPVLASAHAQVLR